MPGALRRYTDCLRLNLRVLRLVLSGRFVSREDVRRSYDRLACDYEASWLTHLRGVTDAVLARIPESSPERILDLGCGTGHTVRRLAARFPGARIVAADISEAMLAEARRQHPGAEYVRADMLDFLRGLASGSADLIVSGWAIGYSRPGAVIRECGRVLVPGGRFVFVVNRADTLSAVRRAFRVCMGRHPEALRRVALPHFPAGWGALSGVFRSAGFQVEWHDEGEFEVCPAPGSGECVLPWLLRTGALAGFDEMLPLGDGGAVADCFEAELQRLGEPLAHRYVAACARRGYP